VQTTCSNVIDIRLLNFKIFDVWNIAICIIIVAESGAASDYGRLAEVPNMFVRGSRLLID